MRHKKTENFTNGFMDDGEILLDWEKYMVSNKFYCKNTGKLVPK